MQALGTEGLCSIVTPQLKFLDTQVQENMIKVKAFKSSRRIPGPLRSTKNFPSG